ncbi:MAG: hypothetical protein U9Q27_00295 [Patescibacteria group bacterium]|nr:hypothetical protein [Patescibacteria group bacterium]
MIAKKSKKKKSIFVNKIFIRFFGFCALLVIGFLIFSNYKIYQKRAEMKSVIQELEKQVQEKELEKQELLSQIEQSYEVDDLERRIREQGYKKENEKVVVIKKQEQEKQIIKEEQSFLEKLLNKFR